MSPSRSPATKDYVDRGVQTITSPSAKTPWLARSLSKTSSSRAEHGSLSEYSYVVPTRAHSRSSTELDSAYSHSLPPDSPSPVQVRPATITRRTHKRQQNPYSRPTPQSNKRVVSLPENPLYNTKTLLESTTLRVVSLPDHLPSSFLENSLSSDSIAASLCTDHSFISGDGRYSLIRRVRSASVDAPHTPSPPSSPDSVLIIDDQDQLSDTFLRRKSVSDSQQLFSDDEGWITWATSPPRPIPALHGPLSLPYARCPSGAEGTIIEENDNLPGMIWGLGVDDVPSTHSRGSSYNPQHETPRMNFSHNSHFKAPPRLQKKKAPSTYLATPQQTPTLLLDSLRDRKAQDTSNQLIPEKIRSRYPHDTYSGAITLDNMLSSGAATVTGTWDSLYGHLAHQPQDSAVENSRGLGMSKGPALDWQSALAQQSLKTSLITNEYANKLARFLKPSAPAFVSSSQPTPSSYPRIFVEPRTTQVHQESTQARRMAAIDIAQQYRQKQNYQTVLPTPPSSSSPLWSSSFSPYQGSLPSPDMAPPRLSRIPNSAVHQKRHISTDASSELRKFVYDRISNAGFAADTSNALSAIVLQSNQAIKSETVAPRSPDVFPLVKHIQYLDLSSSGAINSPPHPGPPPSTPLPPLPPVARDYQSRVGQSSFTNTLPSPKSPEPRPRSVSYPHPRSIPLARLVQRRLSSVPEEDPNSFIERGHALLPSSSQQLSDTRRTQCHVPQAQTVRQTPVTRPQRKQFLYSVARTPSPLPNAPALKRRTQADVGGAELESGLRYTSGIELEVECLPARVKLPHTPLTAAHRAQPRGERDKTAKPMNDSLKENLVRSQDAFRGLNPKKRGRGKKIRASSTIVTQARTPIKGEGTEV